MAKDFKLVRKSNMLGKFAEYYHTKKLLENFVCTSTWLESSLASFYCDPMFSLLMYFSSAQQYLIVSI